MLWLVLCVLCLLFLGAYCAFPSFRNFVVTLFARNGVILASICTFAIPVVVLGLTCFFGYRAFTAGRTGPVPVRPASTQSGGALSEEPRVERTPSGETDNRKSETVSRRDPGKPEQAPEELVQDPPVSEPPKPPVEPILFRSQIVSSKTGLAIRRAKIAMGQEGVVADEDGKVELRLPRMPNPGDTLRVSHRDYVSSVFRYDNLSARTEIRLEPKYRLLVAEFIPRDDPLNKVIRPAAEEQLTKCREIELLPASKRDEIVDKLFRFQEERALYDKDTLAQIGNFHGATHGVFGSINRTADGVIEFECALVHLEKATQTATASVQLAEASLADYGGTLLMDRLLAELTEVKILTPMDGTKVGRRIHVSGYGLFLPASWTLWISVMPLDNSRHFPQMRLTVEADGSWTAPGVQIGNDDPNASNPKFAVYAVLTDPRANERIEQYHERIKISPESNEGLDLASWGANYCKILDRIEVTPPDR